VSTKAGQADNTETTTSLRSVENALRVLTLLLSGRPLRVMDVAAELGIARSTAHRLLTTLRAYGFSAQGSDRQYRAGPALSKVELAPRLRPTLEALALEVNETVHLMVLEGPNIRFIDSIEAQRTLRVGPRIGMTLPAHLTSGGKVLLAELEQSAIDALLADAYKRGGIDRRTLTAVLAEVRERGYASNIEESEVGVCAVGAAIRDPFGRPLAAVAIAAPAARTSSTDLDRLGEIVRAAADRVSKDLWHVDE
jgi:IclR family acetate operon transcriptional repressor